MATMSKILIFYQYYPHRCTYESERYSEPRNTYWAGDQAPAHRVENEGGGEGLFVAAGHVVETASHVLALLLCHLLGTSSFLIGIKRHCLE